MTRQRNLKFLLVDDDEVDIMAVRRAFAKAGIRQPLIVAADGLEALDHLRGTGGRIPIPRPYVILLDLNTPRMNGIEFLRELRTDPTHRDAVVFVLSSSKDEKQMRETYRYNVAGYVVKSASTEGFETFAELLDAYGSLVELP